MLIDLKENRTAIKIFDQFFVKDLEVQEWKDEYIDPIKEHTNELSRPVERADVGALHWTKVDNPRLRIMPV